MIGGSVPEELIHELAKLAPGRSFRRVWSEDDPTGRSSVSSAKAIAHKIAEINMSLAFDRWRIN